MTENELNLTTNCIKALAGPPDSDELIKHLLKNLYNTSEKTSCPQKNNRSTTQTLKKRPSRSSSAKDAKFWIFTKQEIEKMPQKYKKSFIAAEQRVFYRIKVTGIYEARYKRKAEGIKIEVSAKTLE